MDEPPTIEKSGLSRRSKNILYKLGFTPEQALATVSDASEAEIRAIYGAGNKTVFEIKRVLRSYDYSLRRENGT